MVKRKRDANKIIVVGLPEGTDNEALEAMFADIGKVYAAHVVGLDENSGISKGYGFVTFADAGSCTMSIEKMHKTNIEGRTINVRMVEEREPNETKGRDSNKVIVAGLTQSMTDEKLQLMCEEFGLVLKAAVVRNSAGKSKGFGFVTFTNRTCQQACILKLDKRKLGGGRILNVRAVENRQPGDENGDSSSSGTVVTPTNKKTVFEDDGKEGICIRFQTNKCHRGKGCRWKHVKIPNFERSSKKALVEKREKEEFKKEKEEIKGNIEVCIDETKVKRKKVLGKKINGKMISIDQNDTESEEEEEEEEATKEINLTSTDSSNSNGVTVFDDEEEQQEEKEEHSMLPRQKNEQNIVSFSDDDDVDEAPFDNKQSFVSFSDDDEDDSQMNELNKTRAAKHDEFESDLFDGVEEEEEDNVHQSSFEAESKKSMAVMESLLGKKNKSKIIEDRNKRKSR